MSKKNRKNASSEPAEPQPEAIATEAVATEAVEVEIAVEASQGEATDSEPQVEHASEQVADVAEAQADTDASESVTEVVGDPQLSAEAAELAAAQGRAHQLRLVEALLFAAPGLVEFKEIERRLPDGAPVEELVQMLGEQYAGRGVNLVRVAGKVGLRTAPDLAGALDIEVPVTRKLSRAAVETLAIIAYQHAEKKAVTRAEIEEIRGVTISKGTLDALMEAGWIKPSGHRENVPGRPAEWITTDQFLVHFGLNSLAQLPGVEELRAAGLLDRRPGVSQYGEQGALELPPEMGEQSEAEEGPVVDDDAPPADEIRNSA